MNKLESFVYPCIAVRKKEWKFTMLAFYIEAGELQRWCGVYRKAITQEGYQRTLKKEHYGGIKKFLDADESNNVIPNSIVIAFNDALLIDGETAPGAVFNESASYTPIVGTTGESDEETILSQGELRVRVHPECMRVTHDDDDAALEERLSEYRSAYVIDGQHRMAGGNASSTKVYYPVTAFLGIDKEDQAFHYIVINSKAKKVSKHDIDAVIPKEIYENLQSRLSAAGIYTTVADVVWALDNDSDSPFVKQIRWANNADPTAPFKKGGIDNLYQRARQLPPDILEKYESDVALLKAAWAGIKGALGPIWSSGETYIKNEGESYENQFHVKSAAVLPALQEAFNTAVQTSAIDTSGDISTAEFSERVRKYFSKFPEELFYCRWIKTSLTNEDSIRALANKIVSSCRTQKVPYEDKDWFAPPQSRESVAAQRMVEREQRRQAKKKSKKKVRRKKPTS
jgi:DGQHR domain-containing protein